MKLFEATSIGTLPLKNRLVMPPMNSRTANTDGTVSQRTIDYYTRRARGGVGLVVVEIVAVDPVYVVSPTQLRLSDDRFIPGLERLARAIKESGARAGVQLHHPGRQAPSSVTGAQPVAPSPIPSRGNQEVPRELSVGEIETLVTRFAEAARRAKDAGFDAIELHGAHGYLLCQFLSPYSNRRQDGYGGDTQRRARFPLEVVRGVRSRLGQDFPIIFRLSAEEHVEGGLTLEEGGLIARMLEAAGVNAISVSAGTDGAMEWAVQPMLLPKGCLVPSAAAIKRGVDLPVIAVGRLGDPELAEEVLQQGPGGLDSHGPTPARRPRPAAQGRRRAV